MATATMTKIGTETATTTTSLIKNESLGIRKKSMIKKRVSWSLDISPLTMTSYEREQNNRQQQQNDDTMVSPKNSFFDSIFDIAKHPEDTLGSRQISGSEMFFFSTGRIPNCDSKIL